MNNGEEGLAGGERAIKRTRGRQRKERETCIPGRKYCTKKTQKLEEWVGGAGGEGPEGGAKPGLVGSMTREMREEGGRSIAQGKGRAT